MTASDRLRAAAQKIRDTAEAATPGPWGVGNGSTVATEVEQLSRGSFRCKHTITDLDSGFNYGEDPDDDGWRENGAQPEDDAAHIALWSPALALEIADWLEDIAADKDSGLTTIHPRALTLTNHILRDEP